MHLSGYAKRIAKETGVPQLSVSLVLAEAQKTIAERILFGEDVHLVAVGKFRTKVAKAKKCYNFHTKGMIDVPPRVMVYFQASSILIQKLKQKKAYIEE